MKTVNTVHYPTGIVYTKACAAALHFYLTYYAPVATHESIRVLIACSGGERKTLVEAADIDDVYLYGKLDITIAEKVT